MLVLRLFLRGETKLLSWYFRGIFKGENLAQCDVEPQLFVVWLATMRKRIGSKGPRVRKAAKRQMEAEKTDEAQEAWQYQKEQDSSFYSCIFCFMSVSGMLEVL